MVYVQEKCLHHLGCHAHKELVLCLKRISFLKYKNISTVTGNSLLLNTILFYIRQLKSEETLKNNCFNS